MAFDVYKSNKLCGQSSIWLLFGKRSFKPAHHTPKGKKKKREWFSNAYGLLEITDIITLSGRPVMEEESNSGAFSEK